jgi:hypothetical protein
MQQAHAATAVTQTTSLLDTLVPLLLLLLSLVTHTRWAEQQLGGSLNVAVQGLSEGG